ncbi:MAG: cysteine-rich CWC family protein [Paludibacteraceae bacterium]|nr:cysteine-rich CWC family protein [Paludibacteraceae bacterium]
MEIKTCPRCSARFSCYHDDDISRCQCASVRLSKGARLHIALHFPNQCLCIDCLRTINASFPE